MPLAPPNRRSRYHQGYFKPKNPKKYIGDVKDIVYRSGLEKRYMNYLDDHPNIAKWTSEGLIIPYESPVDRNMHRYFTDFVVQTLNPRETYVIEIKPKSKMVPPKVPKRQTRGYLREVMDYAVNEAKWEAARAFCKKKGWKFLVLTEEDIKISF
jgi:hypothetical protein